MERYERQMILPEIGTRGQKAIGQARVLCIGAGGLGCPALQYLVAAGIGHIGIMDGDVVEVSNLQRQILFTLDDVGKNKAECARDRLAQLNKDVELVAHPQPLRDGAQALKLFAGYNVIIDGTDNFAAKFLINDAAYAAGVPVVYASILGFEGQVSVFNYKGGPCYRCLFPEPPPQAVQSCTDAGVIGALAGVMGSMQAMEVVKLIVQHNRFDVLAGRVLFYDAAQCSFREINLPRDADCAICSLSQKEVKETRMQQTQELEIEAADLPAPWSGADH